MLPAGKRTPSSRSAIETKPALSEVDMRECRLSVLEIPSPRASAAIAIAPASPTQPAERKLDVASIMFQKRSALSCLELSEAKSASGSNSSPDIIKTCNNNFRAINEDKIIASAKACLYIFIPAERCPSFILFDISIWELLSASLVLTERDPDGASAHSAFIRRAKQYSTTSSVDLIDEFFELELDCFERPDPKWTDASEP
mmetsp:Transcript_218/g.481  ORF Transcript_218/g.481 Transcript_218/m.481 type:complete len:201 (-) Transcript_218:2344-2946(-)